MRVKRIIVAICLLALIVSISTNVYAQGKSIFQQAKDWISLGDSQKDDMYGNGANAKQPVLDVAGILMGVGIFIAVGVGIILGIKFMLSTAEGKAEISKLLTPYLIGIAIVVGALGIWKAAISILDI